jgi:4-amino-4-deoxy-L-arabinose transferase-like glycosyltransferase
MGDMKGGSVRRLASTPARQGFLVVLAATLLFFSFLDRRELRQDEPRDAEIAREAFDDSWRVVPEINGVPFQERPPLFYWMTAAAYALVGEPTDASAKLVPALFGVLTVASTWLLGEVLLGPGRGWLPALLLLGTPYLFLKLRTCVTDTGLVAFTALAGALFHRAYRSRSGALAAAAGAAAGLAFLCKGLLGLGIPAVAGGSWLLLRRDPGAIFSRRLWLALPAGLAIALPWVFALYRTEGADGLHAFFVVHHLGRLGETADHAKPAWRYVDILWLALPLTPLLAALVGRGNRLLGATREAALAGAAWVLPMFVLLSAIGGKRPIYLLPLFPGIALMAAATLEGAAQRQLAPWAERLARLTVGAVEVLTLQLPFARGRDLRVRAGVAALVLGALALAWDAGVASRRNAVESGHVVAARAAAAAGSEPLVLYRVGEGDIGHFTFALRRKLPVAFDERSLRQKLGDGRAVLLVEQEHWERALATGEISPEFAGSLAPLGGGMADGHVYSLFRFEGGGPPSG